MYPAEASYNGASGTLEVVVNEDKVAVLHALFRGGQ